MVKLSRISLFFLGLADLSTLAGVGFFGLEVLAEAAFFVLVTVLAMDLATGFVVVFATALGATLAVDLTAVLGLAFAVVVRFWTTLPFLVAGETFGLTLADAVLFAMKNPLIFINGINSLYH